MANRRKMRFGIVVFPGSNCDRDVYNSVTRILNQEAVYLWHKDHDLNHCDAVVLPGGFSYGDYLRTGAIARFSPIVQEIIDYAEKGGRVLGICNGFQVLLEIGLLPGAMLRNKSLHFICKFVHVRVENSDTLFTSACRKKEVLKIPIAHNEGNYYIDSEGLKALEGNNQVVFRYASPEGQITEAHNPNGSLNHIAGIVNRRGNVLGLMPHPERASEALLGSEDGKKIFRSMVQAFLD
ncbi:phosphoribosylformylglycinamidine synthase 1 [bacterium BMS3Abin05]|nr:phosphoribosylformylglycinamidine synthase 1 [bacterium BMS3Abin05]GBE26827.1 phosphoribosylformylglycinamidine synthase 1 [bacterium BMS3Bbin03]